MSENCNTAKHPLLRDGTSQLRRLLKALLPSYVSVDERSMDDLIAFARRYAEEIFYYDTNNLKNGNWVEFFNHAADETGSQTEPHYALFLAFLDLFRVAQDDLNTITSRHLDFYYREVLQLKEKPAVPDQVFAIFGLAKNIFTSLLEKGTLLNAGKDAIGKNLDYSLNQDIVVNKATIGEVKAVFADKSNDYRVYASPVANSSDGTGGALEGDEHRWRTFGRYILPGDRPQGDVGFAIASPLLRLAEGNRTVTVTFNFNAPFTNIPPGASSIFNVSFSGAKGWIDIDGTLSGNNTTISGNTIVLTRVIAKSQPGVVDYDSETLGASFDSPWPVMKVLLNTEASSFAYDALKNGVLVSVNIRVDVSEVRNLTLFSDQAKLKADKPFQPFTSQPVLGSSFYIGSAEIFSKRLDSIDLVFTWAGLPNSSFESYYSRYLYNNGNRTNSGFTADVSILDGKTWKGLGTHNLFIPYAQVSPDPSVLIDIADVQIASASIDVETAFAERSFAFAESLPVSPAPPVNYVLLQTYAPRGGFAPSPTRIISLNSSSSIIEDIPRDPELETVSTIDANTFKGFLRLDLSGADFGHRDYPVSLAAQVLNGTPFVVNPPYTPVIKELVVNYSSSITIDLNSTTQNNEDAFNDRVDRYLTIEPFGVREMHPFLFHQPQPVYFLPQFRDEGNLYVGLKNLTSTQVVNILFKVVEGSANPDFEKQDVHWYYLSYNQWIEFPKLKLLSDGTNGLLTSGIVSLEFPSDATNDNTVLPGGMHWLRISVTDFSGAVCDLSAIHAQAMTATFRDNANDPEHLRLPLPGGTISKLRESNSQVKTLEQPYASFGGKVKEASNDFYMRVSERLRHKDRAITIWDYEHLVLEKFPSVYKVKCISHTEDKPSRYTEVAPGHVALIVVSNLRNLNVQNPLQPKTSLTLLEEIKSYILNLTSWWVELDVRNPNFEEIRVNFKVRFRQGYDIGFYSQKLNEDICRHLSPWAYDPGQDIAFGGKIYKSMILDYVEKREYVDYVTCFTMDHITPSQTFVNVEEASTVTAASILVSASNHGIAALETEDCECGDNVQQAAILPADDVNCYDPPVKPQQGIGDETIGDTFIVGYANTGGGIGYFEIEKDFIVE